MKHFLLSALTLLLPVGMPAQTLNADSTWTFRFRAPEGADDVKLDASFAGKGKMKLGDDGVWTFTTDGPLASDMYTYRFTSGKLRWTDPDNPRTVRDIDDTLSYFFVPGQPGDTYREQTVPHGRVEQLWYASSFSPEMKQRRLSVYLPAGYDASPSKRYPVLYLLHGTGGDEMAWLDMGRLAQIMDNMIAAGRARPMIVVMPNGIADLDAAPGQSPYMQGKASHMNMSSWMGRTEAAFPKEVMPFIERKFRTIADKEHRAIAGLSMGGMHAMAISANNPEAFAYVGLFSPQAITPLTDGNIGRLRRIGARLERISDKLPESWRQKYEATSTQMQNISIYEDIDTKLKAQFARPPRVYYIAIGKKDPLLTFANSFRKRVSAAGGTYLYNLSEGGHSWDNWRRYLLDFLPRIF